MGLFTRTRKRAPVSITNTADALFTPVQQRVYGVLFCNSRSFTAREIVALAGTSAQAVERELARLEAAALVRVSRIANVRHYQANTDAPTYRELRNLVLKTSGVADVIRVSLASRAAKIRAAFIYGPIEQTKDSSSSDINLLIISDTLIYGDLAPALKEASHVLGRRITPTLYSSRELARRVRANDPTTLRILAQPRIWLMGVSAAQL
jgi:hypothetical protein